ncbi:MAG: hypothetical protein A4E32_01804 [Methanomassiliicoccales archaeon PtaU1.Bin124]|nr:MAG: hypothetical protein A4E32_01804 [Methanomassiliicoccales archaeon PtaU1.Bin124]
MQTKLVKYSAMALAALLLISFGVAGSANAVSQEKVKYVDTFRVQGEVTLGPEEFLALYEAGMIPECIAQQIVDSGITSVNIYFDGLAHVNLKITQKGEMTDIDLQAFWHGHICIEAMQGDDVMFCATLDFKNAQLSMHLKATTAEDMDINANFHTNAVAIICGYEEEVTLDLDFHIKVLVQDGELKNLKLSVPEWVYELALV